MTPSHAELVARLLAYVRELPDSRIDAGARAFIVGRLDDLSRETVNAREQVAGEAVARDAQLAAMMLDSLIENREVKFHPNGVRDVDHYRELLGVARHALTHPAPKGEDEERVRDALESMAHQFAYRGKRCLTTGGLSALEDAFNALGWPDPKPQDEGFCDAPGCDSEATCGWPQNNGPYRHTCSAHYHPLTPSTKREGG